MKQTTAKSISRRRFLKTAGATVLTASAAPAIIIPGRAQQKTLKILDFKGFDPPGYDQWLPRYVQEWGERNNTQVILDRLIWSDLDRRVTAEAAGQQGHDLVSFARTDDASLYLDQTIDLREVYEECEHRYGKPIDLAVKNGYNPKTGKFYAFILNHKPNPLIYRKDLWESVEKFPDTWEDVWLGGRKIKFLQGPALGIGLSGSPDSRYHLEAILFSFGGSLQDADNRPALKSRQTLEALKFVKALYEEAMTDDVLGWDDTSNNRAMLAEEISLTLNPVNIIRTAENKQLPVSPQVALARPPLGPEQRLAPSVITSVWGVWKFAENVDGARQFLMDWAGSSRQIFLASQFYYFPCYLRTIPDIAKLFADDPKAQPPGKYRPLIDAMDCATYDAYPGYHNAAIAEIRGSGLFQKMFASVATGKMTPEEALIQADQEVRNIYRKWQDLGKI